MAPPGILSTFWFLWHIAQLFLMDGQTYGWVKTCEAMNLASLLHTGPLHPESMEEDRAGGW